MICERPKCNTPVRADMLYCSDECYDADNDPTPVTVLARNKAGGFGHDLHWTERTPVNLPKEKP